jgi:endonuclease YncB( thermonuclease family)
MARLAHVLGTRWLAAGLVGLALASCSASSAERRYTQAEAVRTRGPSEAALTPGREIASLVLGEFPLDPARPILDGDTIRVRGLDATLRLLAVDTEETFKHDSERRAYEAGWEEYLRRMRGTSRRPVKMATPVGDLAKKWAEKFFRESPTVRLERDHPGEIRDFFGRYLAYVYAKKDGRWVNYNLECVRAGMSPYFQKYGRSRRFHAEFVRAQAEAREARRGIWDPSLQHYPDYEERLGWWDARGAAVAAFEEEAPDGTPHVVLTRFDAVPVLEENLNRTVTLFGLIGEIVKLPGEKAPTLVKLAKNRRLDVPLVFFDAKVLEDSGLAGRKGEFVRVVGKVTKYRDRVQIVVNDATQVRTYATAIVEEGPVDEAANEDEELPLALPATGSAPEAAPSAN